MLKRSMDLNTMKIPVDESMQRMRKCIQTYGLKKTGPTRTCLSNGLHF
jgi:hypothetical protein